MPPRWYTLGIWLGGGLVTRSGFALLGFVLAAGLVPFVASARADDDPTSQYEHSMQLVKAQMDLEKALKDGDEDAANAALCRVPELYRVITWGPHASPSKALQPLADAVRQTKFARIRPTALQALFDTRDGENAWKVLKSAYPKDNVEDASKFNVEVVKAVGTLHPEAAVDTLLLTLRSAKQAEMSVGAALALGKYHTSKQRERILGEVVKTAKTLNPAGDGKTKVTPEAQARWDAIHGPIGKGLDELTGTTVGDAVEWIKKVDDAKGNLKSLFKD